MNNGVFAGLLVPSILIFGLLLVIAAHGLTWLEKETSAPNPVPMPALEAGDGSDETPDLPTDINIHDGGGERVAMVSSIFEMITVPPAAAIMTHGSKSSTLLPMYTVHSDR
ncbi:hypothetical protein M413DRAFT_27315 [Hebeloma cylindrosporum]|uniref:Uncharacterized protein n=1 Tax=Hebeloma cylindrosporum TaxID=76867 RepID=A0A0C3BYR6_HEBCY|nr:hypothetical protein M413DRAFT_27315 [Hebeloma cylindrosporum h7]